MRDKKFEVGQLVSYYTGGTWDFVNNVGRITRISPAGSLTVQESGGTFRVFKNCKFGGPKVNEMSEHEIATHRWKNRKPKTSMVWLSAPWAASTETLSFEQNLGSESIEKLINELKKIQVWLSEKPQDHSTYSGSEDD